MSTMAVQIEPQLLEQNKFNSGPRAAKCHPTMNSTSIVQDENSTDLALQPINEDSLDGQLKVLGQPEISESSNLSSAGSTSDRENNTPGKQAKQAEKRSQRKRRRGDETPKSERKITDYIRGSPKRFAMGSPAPNSDGSLQDSDVVPKGNAQSPSRLNRPAQVLAIVSESTSKSNQINPGTGRVDEETQTEDVDVSRDRDRIFSDYRKQLEEAQTKLNIERRRSEVAREQIKRLIIEKNTLERKALRNKTAADQPRIGQYKPRLQGHSFREVFIEGTAFEELQRKTNRLAAERIELANASAMLKKRKPLAAGKEGPKRPAANSPTDGQGSTSSNSDDALFRRPEEPKEISMQEYIEMDEIYKLRREQLKKEEAELDAEKEQFEREKHLYMRELKRASNERDSRYKDHETLNNRYLLLSLLGKGGFSEVWRGYDLEENRYVACKIHQVNKEWKDEKKVNYVKHAIREKEIHKMLDHCRIVKLFDVFTIDDHSFCTVLEYCPGNDLDFYLKQNKTIPEKEARSIIMQLVSALVYLSERKPQIIHYDLKPANILLENGTTSGAIKIADFGLSKLHDDNADDMELTSQFAGTYWYLPPETFMVGPSSRINTKVDIWSVGVIFYQCIYGKKPFGNEQTQQKILEENTIIRATEINFPAKPALSSTAQDFILRCLQYKKEDRADALELRNHELFRSAARGVKPPSSPSSIRSLNSGREDDAPSTFSSS